MDNTSARSTRSTYRTETSYRSNSSRSDSSRDRSGRYQNSSVLSEDSWGRPNKTDDNVTDDESPSFNAPMSRGPIHENWRQHTPVHQSFPGPGTPKICCHCHSLLATPVTEPLTAPGTPKLCHCHCHSPQNYDKSLETAHKTRNKSTPTPAPYKVQEDKLSWNLPIITLSIAVIGVLVYFLYFAVMGTDKVTPEQVCRQAMRHLKSQHPEQEDTLIRSIASASQGLFHSKVNSITLLHYPSSNSSFIQDMLASSRDCTPTRAPIELGIDDFTEEMQRDYGHVLVTYGRKLKSHRIMVVHNVHLLSENVAPAFHTICDTENPLIRPAAIYFTMEIPEDSNVDNRNLDRLAIRILEKQWSELPSHVLEPLITRITNQVLLVK